MPELAEVETVRRYLAKKILGQKIEQVKIYYPRLITPDSLPLTLVTNQQIKAVERRGKWLLFKLTDYYLLSHLRMEGKYWIRSKLEPRTIHEHLILELTDFDLRYQDTRKFGRLVLIHQSELNLNRYLKRLGPEPLQVTLTKEYLKCRTQNKTQAVKTLLLDQTIISGLGNIYVNEILFAARINPFKKGKEITMLEWDRIVKETNRIITAAISQGGTTIKSFTSSYQHPGHYQTQLQVYRQAQKPCPYCHNLIQKEKFKGRSTYYCPNCQK